MGKREKSFRLAAKINTMGKQGTRDEQLFSDLRKELLKPKESGVGMELSELYLLRDELTFFKRAYVKMNKEQICMGCTEYYEWQHAYCMTDYDMKEMFYGHKNCLGMVKKRVDELKEKFGVDKVVQTINETKGSNGF